MTHGIEAKYHHSSRTTCPQALRSAIGSSGAALVLLEMSLLDDVGDPMGFARYHMVRATPSHPPPHPPQKGDTQLRSGT
jgi:hypothetical protein